MPKSALQLVPEWYKAIPKTSIGSKTVKNCMPFLDSLTSGYIATTWQDVKVSYVNGNPHFDWQIQPDIIGGREKSANFKAPAGYDQSSLFWISNMNIKVPNGYSLLITHPFNRFDLPFITATGIVDADAVMHSGKIPFFIEEGFEGVIPKGTPMYQVLPFKRDSWTSEVSQPVKEQGARNVYEASSVFSGWYRKNVWKRKVFKDGK